MNEAYLPDYLAHILEATSDAMGFVTGMRNRITHGYFDINLDVVWNTIQTALPELRQQLSTIQKSTD